MFKKIVTGCLLVLFFTGTALAGPSLVGLVTSANTDATFKLYQPDNPSQIMHGNLNDSWGPITFFENANNFSLGAPVAGTDLVTVVDYETNPDTVAHAGYYAVINDDYNTSTSPQVFNPTKLRKMPSPNVLAGDGKVSLSWSTFAEDTGDPAQTNITGYQVYRSTDSVNFTRIADNVTSTTYVDGTVVNGGFYFYALGIVFKGGVTSNYYSESSLVAKPSNPPTTPNAIYPTHNLNAIPARPFNYNVSFTTTENIDHDSIQFDIYFGREGEDLTLVGQNLWTWASGITGFNVGTINCATTYNWKVVAKDAAHPGVETEGPTFSFRTQEAGEVDRYENGDVNFDPDWFIYDAANIASADSTAEGSIGMRVSGQAADWYIGGTGVNYWQDVSTYNYIALSVKSINDKSSKIIISLNDGDSDDWTYQNVVEGTEWVDINVPISSFAYTPGTGDGVWSPAGGIGCVPQVKLNLNYAVEADKNASSLIGYCVDNIRFMQSGSLADSQPQIIARTPSGNDYFAPLGTVIRATFSEAMDKTTVESSFSITPAIAGSFSWFGNTLIFSPLSALEASTTYNVAFDKSVAKDADGQALIGNADWQFNTSSGVAGYDPEVIAWSPKGTDAPLDPTILITFSEDMNKSSVESRFSFNGGSGTIIWVDDNTLAFFPDNVLSTGTSYKVTITSGAADVDGDTMSSPFSFYFETSASAGGTAPYVMSHSPVGSGIGERPTINILFSEAMPVNVTQSVTISGNPAGVFTWSGNLLEFVPAVDLETGLCFVTAAAGIVDNEGDAMANADVWSFLVVQSDITPPNNVDGVTISRNGSAIILLWKAPTDNVTATSDLTYEVYRSSDPQFAASENIASNVTGLQTTVQMASGSTLNYFMVKAVDLKGNISGTSNLGYSIIIEIQASADRVMEYWFSLPGNTYYKKASDIANEIDATKITEIGQRDYDTQQVKTYAYVDLGFGGAWGGTDFEISTSSSYYFTLAQSSELITINVVGAQNIDRLISAMPSNNRVMEYWFSMPYNADYQYVSDIAAEMDINIVSEIGQKEYDSQQVKTYSYVDLGFGGAWGGDDFVIEPGKAYYFTLKTGADEFNWQPKTKLPQ
ncbi:Ig-like domain-containing protein [Candidatus Margulisiibacteriota bacterium]